MMACERDVSPAGVSIEGYHRPTLSVGLALVHHLEPMGEALSVARDAERHAKLAGRNALAIKAVPRGGAPYEASAQWPSEAQPEGLVERLHAWMGWLESGALPRGVSHDLMTAADLFDERQGPQSATLDLDGPFKAYVTQVIQQKRSRGGQDTAGEAPIEAIYAYFEGCQGAEDRHQRVLQLAHELEIARFFKRAYEAAWPQTGARAL
jgi:CRISPR-associated protein Cmr2